MTAALAVMTQKSQSHLYCYLKQQHHAIVFDWTLESCSITRWFSIYVVAYSERFLELIDIEVQSTDCVCACSSVDIRSRSRSCRHHDPSHTQSTAIWIYIQFIYPLKTWWECASWSARVIVNHHSFDLQFRNKAFHSRVSYLAVESKQSAMSLTTRSPAYIMQCKQRSVNCSFRRMC